MRALVLVKHGRPGEAFELREVPDPVAGPGDVLIRVEVSGLNFADVLARLGLYREAPPLPSVLGYEVVGRVEATGQRVVAFTRFGGYAARAVAPALVTVPIPDDFDAVAASALAAQGATAYYAAEEAVRLHPGDHVLVHAAAGGVGSLLVQLARRRDAIVYATAGSDAKLALLRDLGVAHAINYRTHDFAAEFRRAAGGRGADVVFDSIGGSTLRRGLGLLASGGRLVTFGAAGMAGAGSRPLRALGTIAGAGLVSPLQLTAASKGIIGINMLKLASHRPEVVARCLRESVALGVRGELRPLATQAFPPERMAEAHALLESRASVGKLAVRWE